MIERDYLKGKWKLANEAVIAGSENERIPINEIARLARFLLDKFPGVMRGGSSVDVAIRLLRELEGIRGTAFIVEGKELRVRKVDLSGGAAEKRLDDPGAGGRE
jgi:hypothetical protein